MCGTAESLDAGRLVKSSGVRWSSWSTVQGVPAGRLQAMWTEGSIRDASRSDYSALEANILLLGQLLVFILVLTIGLSFYLVSAVIYMHLGSVGKLGAN
jgi:hypothetical protein